MLNHVKGYQACLSVDLRCFDNRKIDMGVEAYFEELGYLPNRLFNHETYMDQIHTHNGIIDDTMLEPQWVSQRAMPGAQSWTERQYKQLIDEIHKYGVKFYQGCEAAWSCWPEYGSINRCNYLYDHLPEIFIVDRTGRTTAQDSLGGINPLRRFRDGSLYEDMICRDVKRFLLDYECDGFFAADGFAGLIVPLRVGCFADDMIEQFTEHTGISIPAGTTLERSSYIWDHYQYEWTVFYSDRWAEFSAKLSSEIHSIQKELTIFTPFQHGPADSLKEYGYDYGKCARAGIKSIALEVMEEVTGRRFGGALGWESVGICNTTTAKAAAENLEILWTTATCNCPEHWHTLRDQPNIIERECLALGEARTINSKGEYVRAVDGALTIFGIDLSHPEWCWLRRRWDEGFGYQVKKPIGPVILWDDKFVYECLKQEKAYPLSQAVTKLRYSGIPISQAARLENILQVHNSSFLLVEPLGLEDEKEVLLEEAVNRGAVLIVMGEVDNVRLLKFLGIQKTATDGKEHQWEYFRDTEHQSGKEKRLEGYCAINSEPVVSLDNGNVVVSVKKNGNGSCIYVRRLLEKMPAIDIKRIHKENEIYFLNMKENEKYSFGTIREQLDNMIKLHPDALDLMIADTIQQADKSLPVPNRGQMLGFECEDGSQILLMENSANLNYSSVNVKLPGNKKMIREFPEIRPIGPVGYLFFGESKPDEFDVCLPPETCIPVQVWYQDK